MHNNLLCCKQCGTILTPQPDAYVCGGCSESYRLVDGIVLMENKDDDVDLRIGDDLLDLHKLRDERKYFNSIIKSNVEYFARLHSVEFTNFHVELLLPYIHESSTIVDLGCGQLPSINFFPNAGVGIYYGLDLSIESLVIAQDNFKRDFPLSLIQHSITEIPFSENSVDIIISSEVLEHIDNPHDYLREMFKKCKKGGYMSLSTPCVSMYFYPFNYLIALRSPKAWYKLWHKQINAHECWGEALEWHPGIRPKILREWVAEAGFSIVRHETRLWYYHTPIRLMWRTCSFLEKIGFSSAGKLFRKYLGLTDKILSLNIPLIRWGGTRQFILCKKDW